MTQPSRRQFLAVSGAGAVAVGAATIVPASLAAAAEAPGQDLDSEHGVDALLDDSPMIVSVDDLASGQLSIMHGDREFSVTDHALAQRIAHIARSEA